MTCCDEHATIKTSKLGTQFLRTNVGASASAAETTAEHLFVKVRIAKAIRGTGWKSTRSSAGWHQTEACGSRCDGQPWATDTRRPAERGRQYDAQRLGGVEAMELISHLPGERQARD